MNKVTKFKARKDSDVLVFKTCVNYRNHKRPIYASNKLTSIEGFEHIWMILLQPYKFTEIKADKV